MPGLGALPTDGWRAGRVVETSFVLHPPAGLESGAYRLVTGFYDAATGAGLSLTDGGDKVTLWEAK